MHSLGSNRRFALGVMLAVVVLSGLSCTVDDPLYCTLTADDPLGEADCKRILGSDADGQAVVCQPIRHVCITNAECIKDEDCTQTTLPRCDLLTNGCMPCTLGDDSTCSRFNAAPICGQTPEGGTQCIGCLKNKDCPASTPICDSRTCRACSQHKECEGELRCDNDSLCTDSMVCIHKDDLGNPALAGRCAANGTSPSGRVVYVNMKDMKCRDDGSNSGMRFSEPFCTLKAAREAAVASSKLYVRLVGGTYEAPGGSMGASGPFTSGRFIFIGAPGKNFQQMADVESRDVLFEVLTNADVVLEQVDMHALLPLTVAVRCSGGGGGGIGIPKLTMRRNIVRGSVPSTGDDSISAVSAAFCNLVLDGNIIGVTRMSDLASGPAHGVGVTIVDDGSLSSVTSYRIENNIIAGNNGVGLNLSPTLGMPSVIARFNTIWGNGRKGKYAGGILCPQFGQREVAYSIVAKNGLENNTQFGVNVSKCTFKNVLVGSAEGSPAFPAMDKVDPDLDDTFHLDPTTQNNKMFCIDRIVPTMSEQLPAWDVDNQPRPLAGKWDIGADELTSP